MPMPPVVAAVLAALLPIAAAAAPGIPDDSRIDSDIPTPAEVLGFEPGERHPRHDQVVHYFRTLADASPRVQLEEIGTTHGGRPVLLAHFGPPERLADLESLRQGRRQASLAGDGPPVVWLGYSVHGNEASGSSAALVMAWYLAASRDERVQRWLEDLVIIMEPAINPDGLDRFAHWVNMHRGRNPAPNPMDREHREAWPDGRTSYYWFDLNRDWLPLTHPESRARIREYHRWRPHVLTDAHEMGHEASYFFQPGVPERASPYMPDGNQELTERLGRFHGEILDEAGEPHFTRESYDDYYIGKGSTYPDVTGGIGILFEQGSVRGHLSESPWGERAFVDAIANQVRTSISTLDGSRALADELLDYQATFLDEAPGRAGTGWLLGDDGDPARAAELIRVLLDHGIRVHPVDESVNIDDREYGPGHAWAIPADQHGHRLLQAMFDVSDELPMDTFYDVSAWPLQMAFGLPLESARHLPARGEALEAVAEIAVETPAEGDAPAAWVVAWDQYRAPALLAALLADGYRVQAATRPLHVTTAGSDRELVRGSLVIFPGTQPDHLAPVSGTLEDLAARYRVQVLAVRRGVGSAAPDLGSPSVPMLEAPKPALLTGPDLNAYSAGYVWHWFDRELDRPLTRIDWLHLHEGLGGHSHLILPDGEYDCLPEWTRNAIQSFVLDGGQVIALRRAVPFVESLQLEWAFANGDGGEEDDETAACGARDPASNAPAQPRPYGDFQDDSARQLIGGSVLEVDLDITHPLGFGYQRDTLAVMRRGTQVLRPVGNAYVHPARYTDTPLAAGFLSEENRERLAGSPAIAATHHGSGLVVRIADDPVFRGYWRGTERLLANALFFGQLVEDTTMPEQ